MLRRWAVPIKCHPCYCCFLVETYVFQTSTMAIKQHIQQDLHQGLSLSLSSMILWGPQCGWTRLVLCYPWPQCLLFLILENQVQRLLICCFAGSQMINMPGTWCFVLCVVRCFKHANKDSICQLSLFSVPSLLVAQFKPHSRIPTVLTANLPSIDFSNLMYFKNSSYLKVIMDVQILIFVRIYLSGSQSIATITFNHHRKALH